MLQEKTTPQNGKVTTLPTQLATISQANEPQKIISVNAEEVKRLPTVPQVFEKIQQGIALQEYHQKSNDRLKDVSDFFREAKEETGFILKGFLPSGRTIEFQHLPSNLDYVEAQEIKGRNHLKNLEKEIQNFSID